VIAVAPVNEVLRNGADCSSWIVWRSWGRFPKLLTDPITVDGVANINSLKVFDSVYTTVCGKPFAALTGPVRKED
jgi:para-nitrobenzyl esterase